MVAFVLSIEIVGPSDRRSWLGGGVGNPEVIGTIRGSGALYVQLYRVLVALKHSALQGLFVFDSGGRRTFSYYIY